MVHIIEIQSLTNGAHRNQNGQLSSVPDGWAIVPEGMTIPDTFPFVDITVADGAVTSMTAGVVPEPEPIIEEPTEQEDIDAMLVDHEYRLTLIELGVTE